MNFESQNVVLHILKFFIYYFYLFIIIIILF
jgi:hypothetical protein